MSTSNRNNTTMIHANAVSLARRWSVQNEHDLMQEDMYDNTMDMKRQYDHDYCQDLASHLHHLKSLPTGCMQYTDIASELKRRDSDTTHPTQFMG